MAILTAYFDESGTHDDSAITAIAGYVAEADVWAQVESDWQKVLGEFADRGLHTFHATDSYAGNGEFGRLDSFWRNYVRTQLSDILERSDIQAIWAGVNVDDWDDLTTDAFRARYPKPYDLCFEEVVKQLFRWSRHHVDGSPVSLVFGVQSEYQNRASTAYKAWLRHPEVSKFLGALSFGFPKTLVPLQAADMLAHEMNMEWEKVEFGELNFQNVGLRPFLEKITRRHGLHGGGLFGSQGLRTAMARFLKNQS